jgi:hypothetical protein
MISSGSVAWPAWVVGEGVGVEAWAKAGKAVVVSEIAAVWSRAGAKSVDKSKKFASLTEEWSILRCGTDLAQPASHLRMLAPRLCTSRRVWGKMAAVRLRRTRRRTGRR